MDTSHLLSASDLTDRDWALLEPLLPPESPVGRPRLHSLRIIRNAIFYELRTGGAPRVLPPARPPAKTGWDERSKGRPEADGGGRRHGRRELPPGRAGRWSPPPRRT